MLREEGVLKKRGGGCYFLEKWHIYYASHHISIYNRNFHCQTEALLVAAHTGCSYIYKKLGVIPGIYKFKFRYVIGISTVLATPWEYLVRQSNPLTERLKALFFYQCHSKNALKKIVYLMKLFLVKK